MTASVPDLDRIVAAVEANQPRIHGGRLSRRRAATALILHDHEGVPEILFMLRSSRPDDRWSGQMALPGGRWHEEDPDLATTAARETHEEVGVALSEPVGRLDDQGTRVAPVIVSTFVHVVDDRPEVVLDPREAEDAVWIPVPRLLHPDAAVRYRYGGIGVFPGIQYEGYTIWGLTLRTLEAFFELLDQELPRPDGLTFG